MIERINVREIPLDMVLISCRKDFILDDNYFCNFSLLVIITIFQFIEADSWINPKGFIPQAWAFPKVFLLRFSLNLFY